MYTVTRTLFEKKNANNINHYIKSRNYFRNGILYTNISSTLTEKTAKI